MGETIGAVLAFAVGVGVSPIPIVAVILMLFSPRANVNGPLFLVGWLLGLSIVATAFLLLAEATGLGGGGTDDSGVAWVRLVLGVLLLVAAGRKWATRPGPDDEPPLPKWMAGIDRARPSRAFGLAVVLSANPKNLLLAAGAASSLVAVPATTAETVVALATFVVVGSAFVIVAVGYAIIGGRRAEQRLASARAWLTANNTAVMAVLFLVFGVVLVARALEGA